MTTDEAEKVVRILVTADLGCIVCSEHLISLFLERWPEHKSVARSVFGDTFASEWTEPA